MSSVFRPAGYAETNSLLHLQLGSRPRLVGAVLLCLSIRCAAQTPMRTPATPQGSVSTYPSPTTPGASPVSSGTIPAAVPSPDQSHYVISPGDVLDVSVYGAPDLSQKSAVNSAGDIYMPLINYVHVAGMHAEEAQAAVEQAYFKKGIIKLPHVGIVIATYSSGVVLMGEVGRPGIYPIVGSGRLFDILAEAGGTTPSAGQMISITHKDSTNPQIVFLASDPVKTIEANVPVEQGDTIIVSKAGVIYVVGEVHGPSGFLMDERDQYTVMKAVAMAHGLTKFAKPSNVRIVRRTPSGQEEIPVPLDKILVSQSPDIPMQSNDILFVPSSRGKQFAARAADVAVALASGVAFYGIYH